MIAVCPKCATRYRVADEQLARGELRLRCTRCEAVFRVRAPAASAAAGPEPVTRSAAGSSSEHEEARERALAPAAPPLASRDAVVVAHPDAEVGKRLVAWLAAGGLEATLVHDGVEAILALQRRLPRLAIVDATIGGLGAAQLCELVKRNAELRRIALVVAESAAHRTCAPEGFGPSASIARERVQEELPGVLQGLGIRFSLPVPGVTPESREGASDLRPASDPAPVPSLVAAPAVPGAPGDPLATERAKAERLARIIVSDVILYHEEKFARAVAEGNVLQVFDADFADGRNLFRQRVDERVREERDFIGDELLRVARAKGMKEGA